ncbi:MAG: hypothetical protein LBK61_02190 [Spirochaetaceae bacterium]|jgi:hypothetical protein|nr:hypothetical protein [Spirochaetaceae bacterium]
MQNSESAPAGAKTRWVFIPLRNSILFLPKISGNRQNTVMRRLCFPFGRAMPPHDGILPAKDDAG